MTTKHAIKELVKILTSTKIIHECDGNSVLKALDRGEKAKKGEDLIVADWKTGATIWEEYVLQVAAYTMAWNEHCCKPGISKARIVSLNRDTGIPAERIVEKKELKVALLIKK